MVIGNSGCGKSSLVRAGLISALRDGRFNPGERSAATWRIAVVRPSASPFDYLAEVLPSQLAPELGLGEQAGFIADCRSRLSAGGEALRDAMSAIAHAARPSNPDRMLLVVDQFEELFTLTQDHQLRARYIDALLAAARWDASVPVHLVLVLRADFYPSCLEHRELSRCLEDNLFNVPRMGREQLRETIEKRLVLADASAEPGLIENLLDEVGEEPGDLALLEHALSQLWERCWGGARCMLANQAYAAIGRLRGALSAHADRVYGEIKGQAQKVLAQRIFLELVHIGEGAPDTRRRVVKQELLALGPPEEVESLLGHLASSRLISISAEGEGETKQSFVEVSHEALIREWSALREWISQNREELLLERRLLRAAQEWESLQRDPGALLQGARLAQGEEWLARRQNAAPLLQTFIQASLETQAAAARKQEQALQRELEQQKSMAALARRAAARLRWFSTALAALLLLALGTAWFVHRGQVLAEARALAAQSGEMLARDQGRALDLALRAWNTAKTTETYLGVTKALPQTLSVLQHDGDVVVAVFAPDGKRVLTTSYDHTARIWDVMDGRLLVTLRGHTERLRHAFFSPDGQRVVTTSYDHTARIWDANDGRLLVTLQGHTDKVEDANFSPDGQRVATASWDHTARIWNATDGRLLATLQGHTDFVYAARFSPDGKRIVTGSYDHTARVWNVADGRLLATLQGHESQVFFPEFSPDGRRIVTASVDHTARLWDAADGRLLATLRHDSAVLWAAFSANGQRIVTGSEDHTARVWNASDGDLLLTLHHEGAVTTAKFSADNAYILTASMDHRARVWKASDGRLLATLQGHSDGVWAAMFSPDGRRIVTASADHTARIWNLAGGRWLACKDIT